MKVRIGVTFSAVVVIASGLIATPAQAAPGGRTAAQVNAAVKKGVAYIDAHQNANGSFGTSEPVAETGMSLLAYSVIEGGNFANLSASYQAHVKKAITWLLSQQVPAGANKGSWGSFLMTYDTSLAIAGMSAFASVNAKAPAAITAGRKFLIDEFQAPPFRACSSANGSPTAGFCGGWNYNNETENRSDESNTGFAMTGLHLSGGVPGSIASVDIGWQHHIQQIKTNSFATRQDGGGGYVPGSNSGSFSSNANDTGSMLFSLAFSGVKASDPNAAAGIKFGQDVLNTYELALPAHTMAYHSGVKEDGSCKPGVGNCDWFLATGEGGYHYSLFALAKGLGSYITPDLSNASNWYAKVADLLLGEQAKDGSWPADLRDDASLIFATGLSVSALGLVAVQTIPTLPVTGTANAGTVTFTGTVTPPAATTPTPTGSVTWAVTGPDGKSVLCTASALDASEAGNTAVATCTVTGATAGSYAATATYSGDANYKGASGSASVVVAQATTPTSVAQLPRTGSSTLPLFGLGLGLLVLGLSLLGLRRKPRQI